MRALKGAWVGAKRVPKVTVMAGAVGLGFLAFASLAWVMLPVAGAVLALADEQKKKDLFDQSRGAQKLSEMKGMEFLNAFEKELDAVRAEVPEPEEEEVLGGTQPT